MTAPNADGHAIIGSETDAEWTGREYDSESSTTHAEFLRNMVGSFSREFTNWAARRMYAIADLMDRGAQQAREAQGHQADTKRLDWLEKRLDDGWELRAMLVFKQGGGIACEVSSHNGPVHHCYSDERLTFRDALDETMARVEADDLIAGPAAPETSP